MTFSQRIAKHFEEKLEYYFKKEQIDPELLSQEQFDSCYARAMAWIEMSFKESKEAMATDAGYTIAVHRETDHKEDTMEEQAKLLDEGADPELSTRSFWMG